ncbi:MAG TPA: DUF72 domain-containing protein [Alphaproteobacteria bacterium]
MSIRIGTSGWNYDGWLGSFYPEGTKQKDLLKTYSTHFKTTEVNNSFYNLPEVKTAKNWYAQTPKDFVFAVKASRFITHMKKLKVDKDSIKRFFTFADALEEKLGPILFQLPPRWKANPERLKTFLKALPKSHRYAFELRDQTWLNDEIFEILHKHNACHCIYDFKGFESPENITADFAYLRLHGMHKQAYSGNYSVPRLKKYAGWIKDWQKNKLDVFVYFDNDQKAHAPKDAHRLIDLIK